MRAESTAQSIFNFFVGDIFLYLIAFAASLARIKIYEVDNYGFWMLAQSLTPMIAPLAVFGLPLYLLITIPKLDSQNQVVEIIYTIKRSIILILYTDLGIILLSVIVIKASFLPGNYIIPIKFLLLFIIPISLKTLLNNIFVALRKSKIIIVFNFLEVFIGAIITIGIYLLVPNIVLILIYMSVGSFIISAIQIFYIFKLFPTNGNLISSVKISYTSIFFKSINYGKWIILSSLMWMGYNSISLLVASSKNLVEVAYIGFAIVVTTAFFVPFTRISDVILQKLSREYIGEISETVHKTKESQNILLPFFLITLSIFIILTFILIKFLYWQKYSNAVNYIYLLLASMPFLFLFYLMKNVPIAHEKIRLANMPEYFAFFIFLLSLYPLYHLIGPLGVIVSVFLARVCIFVFILLLYGKYTALSYKWLPFSILIPLSILSTYNFIWLIPFMASSLFLLITRKDITYKYWNFAKLQFFLAKDKISSYV